MNPEKIGKQIIKRLLMEEEMTKVSLYPGAFKPPHKGHVEVALRSIDDKTDKVIVFLSTKEREGVDVEEAKKVWDLYKANIPELEKIEIHPTPTPVKAVYDYAKDNPAHDIRAVFGKGEEERFKSLLDKEKYPHVEVFDAGVVDDFSATTLRKAIKDNDLETIEDYIPYLINVDDFLSIFQLNEAIVGDKIVCDNCGWEWKIEDGGDDLYICHKCGHDNTPSSLQEKINPDSELQIKKYIEDYSEINVDILKDLLKIKSKYPKELDPKSGGNKYGYRGTTFNKEFINKLKVKNKTNGVTEYEVPSNLKINSKGDKGFLSFSTDEEVAKGFGHYSGYVDYKKSPDKVGGYVKVSLDNPNFILHPDYMNSLSKDMEYSKENEKETLYIGNSYSPESIYIVDEDIYNLNETRKDYLLEARYKKFLNEGWEDSKAKTINRFMDFASDYLSVERPKIKLINQEGYTQEYRSFGGYLPSEEKIFVVVHNRNMADILRTLAHEMVHHMQNADNRLNPKSGEDGSPEENEANALAGVLMRKFGRENVDIYE